MVPDRADAAACLPEGRESTLTYVRERKHVTEKETEIETLIKI